MNKKSRGRRICWHWQGPIPRHVARLLSLVLLLSGLATAQRDLGTIAGMVTDSGGGAVPNATVTIIEDAAGLTYKVATNETGGFVRPALRPGTYTVTAEAKGFRQYSRHDLTLNAGARVDVPIALTVGEVTESVVVTGEAALLQTASTTLGANLGASTITDLPLGGTRNFTAFARLSPGVLPSEPGARDSMGGSFSVNGVRSAGQNNFLLNGIDNNVNTIDMMNQSAYVIGPPPEAIGEMTVLTSGYNAEYGRAAGGVVNVNLKSGTNELHGGLWEILQNDKLNANSWENNRAGKKRPPFKQNQFGAAAGGPIVKNRFFVFGDYQGTRIASFGGAIPSLGSNGFYTIPTDAMKKGDFSGLLGGVIGTSPLGSINAGEIFDPASTRTVGGQQVRDPFPGNQIPLARMDPATSKIIQLFPSPNQPVNGFPLNDYFAATPGYQNTDSGDLRSDFKLSDKNSLFGSASWQDRAQSSVQPLGVILNGNNYTNGASETDLSRSAQLGFTRVWSPAVISESRLAFNRSVTDRLQSAPTVDQFKAFGIGGLNPTLLLPNNGGLPQIGATRYTTFGGVDWLPTKEYSNVWDGLQNVMVNKGSHSLKFGFEYRSVAFPFSQFNQPHGEMNFTTNGTAYPSTAKGTTGATFNTATGDAIASFLLGNVDNGNLSTTNFVSSFRRTYAVYVQDDWKVSPKLTLSLGLRYELFSPVGEKFARQATFNSDNVTLYIPKGPNQDAPLPPNFATSFPNVKVSRGEVGMYLIPWDKYDFGPRIGIAYNVAARTVIRVGFGIFYGGEENQGASPNRGMVAPFNSRVSLGRLDQNLKAIDLFAQNVWFPGGFSAGIPTNVYSLPTPLSLLSLAPDFRNPMVQKWNFAVQRELPSHAALEVAYVGNHSLHQLMYSAANPCPNFGTTNSSITCDSLRLIPYVGAVNASSTFGYGNYHSLTAKLEKRMSKGLQLLTSYTYGHALADAGNQMGYGGNNTAAAIVSSAPGIVARSPLDYSSGYASAPWDIRHNFTTAFTYELPVGKGKPLGSNLKPVINHILGGWGVNGILSLRTGPSYTLSYNGCQGVWNACVPDVVAGKDPNAAPAGGRTPNKWFDTSAVTTPAPLTGGNLGSNTMRAPGQRSLDFSLAKTFPFNERWNLEFRAEAMNVFNTPYFSIPDGNLQDAAFGQVLATQTGSTRHGQFSLRLHF